MTALRSRVSVFLVLALSTWTKAQSVIRGPPRVDSHMNQRIVRTGEAVKLQCPITGFPTPIIEWSKEGENIDFTWTRYRMNKKFLKIRNAVEDDTGVFYCKGVNGFGSEQVRIELIVLAPSEFVDEKSSPPVFTSDTKSAKAHHEKEIGETFVAACEALGVPRPEIRWLKDGEPIEEVVRPRGRGVSTVDLRVMGGADAGVYTCHAYNGVGVAEKNFTLKVDQTSHHAVVTEVAPSNRTVREGDRAELMCRVKSIVPPHIKWLKRLDKDAADNLHYTLNVGSERYRVLQTDHDLPIGNGEYVNTLVIPAARPEDAGMYICFVTNSGFGALTYKAAHLRVQASSPTNPTVPGDSFPILLVVVSLAIAAFAVLTTTAVCVVRRRRKEEVDQQQRHLPPINLTLNKLDQPLQWTSHHTVYPSYNEECSHYEEAATMLESPGNMYEVPYGHLSKMRYPPQGGSSAGEMSVDFHARRNPHRNNQYFQYLTEYDEG